MIGPDRKKTMIRIAVCFCFLLAIVVIDALKSIPISLSSSSPAVVPAQSSNRPRILLAGGTGQIGIAAANHFLYQCPNAELVLVGRSKRRAALALQQLQQWHPNAIVSTVCVSDLWSSPETLLSNNPKLLECIKQSHIILHTAGPYANQSPTFLDAVLNLNDTVCQVYVDVSDPLEYLQQALERYEIAKRQEITVLLAAGAFPGMSNVLAMEAASRVLQTKGTTTNQQQREEEKRINDLYFQYFTAGLGGSGDINLYITNLGFGDDMVQFYGGKLCKFADLSGRSLGIVDFGYDRVGQKQVFSWPFPEAATVAQELNITGNSLAAMGTAPDLWNAVLSLLVEIIPRSWWRNSKFSQFLADFSKNLVALSDRWLKLSGVGELHAMRVDVIGSKQGQGSGRSGSGGGGDSCVSIVQVHESFQQCVGQSCAVFALDCLDHLTPGVFLPEQRYRDVSSRRRIISKLTTTPGTLCYTGPLSTKNTNNQRIGPTKFDTAMEIATTSKRR